MKRLLIALVLCLPPRAVLAQALTNFWVGPDSGSSTNAANWSLGVLPAFDHVILIGTNQFGPGTGGSNTTFFLDGDVNSWNFIISNYTGRVRFNAARTLTVSNNVWLGTTTALSNALANATFVVYGSNFHSLASVQSAIPLAHTAGTLDFRSTGSISFGNLTTNRFGTILAGYTNQTVTFSGGTSTLAAEDNNAVAVTMRIKAMGGTLSASGHGVILFNPLAGRTNFIDALPGSTVVIGHVYAINDANNIVQDWGSLKDSSVALTWYGGPRITGGLPWVHLFTNNCSFPSLALGFGESGGNHAHRVAVSNATVSLGRWASNILPSTASGAQLICHNATLTIRVANIVDKQGLNPIFTEISNSTVTVVLDSPNFIATNNLFILDSALTFSNGNAVTKTLRLNPSPGRFTNATFALLGNAGTVNFFCPTNMLSVTISGPNIRLASALTATNLILNSGTLDVNGNTSAVGALSGNGGTITDNGTGTVTTTITVNQSINTMFAGVIRTGISNTVALTKAGSGALTLTGANTYSGDTTVSNGTLLVNGAIGTGTVAVVTGATLGGTGTINGPVTISGALAPGGSVGNLTINSNVTFNVGAALNVELGASNDLVAVSGDLVLNGTLNVADAGGFVTNNYTLITYTGTLTGNGLAVGTTPNPSFSYAINTNTAGLVKLVVTPGVTAFEQWQIDFFGSTNNPAADANADPDGDGQNNLAEFLSGTVPTNSASAFRIISVERAGIDVKVTWNTIGGKTNVVQATGGDSGQYTNSFTSLNGHIEIAGSGDVTTNYSHTGGATNVPARYYRIKLVP